MPFGKLNLSGLPSVNHSHTYNADLLQDPRCAKVTIAGEIFKVPDEDIELAKELMFRRHRQMRDWHAHKFTL